MSPATAVPNCRVPLARVHFRAHITPHTQAHGQPWLLLLQLAPSDWMCACIPLNTVPHGQTLWDGRTTDWTIAIISCHTNTLTLALALARASALNDGADECVHKCKRDTFQKRSRFAMRLKPQSHSNNVVVWQHVPSSCKRLTTTLMESIFKVTFCYCSEQMNHFSKKQRKVNRKISRIQNRNLNGHTRAH